MSLGFLKTSCRKDAVGYSWLWTVHLWVSLSSNDKIENRNSCVGNFTYEHREIYRETHAPPADQPAQHAARHTPHTYEHREIYRETHAPSTCCVCRHVKLRGSTSHRWPPWHRDPPPARDERCSRRFTDGGHRGGRDPTRSRC